MGKFRGLSAQVRLVRPSKFGYSILTNLRCLYPTWVISSLFTSITKVTKQQVINYTLYFVTMFFNYTLVFILPVTLRSNKAYSN